MAETAIYARKSVFREESVSVESQIELCRYETRGEEHIVYEDNGYSGKNTDRPGFRRMMEDIRAGKIKKVIVYRLDRISRSVLDFSEMMEKFQRYGVDFISATEHFDTSSPMGRAMLNICIVFAQLERETIQQRVIDAYASRSKKGFFMGGRTPYGYRRVPVTIGGVKTSMYEQIPEEAADIRLIYELYSRPSVTLGDVLRELRRLGRGQNLRGSWWSVSRLSELIRSPVYTSADLNMYSFFREQKCVIADPPEKYNGVTSLYLFRARGSRRRTWDLSGQTAVVAPHIGIVSPELWLACRKKLLGNHQIRSCKAKNSFLSGRIKCACCGSAMHIVRSNRRADGSATRYFRCGGNYQKRCCDAVFPTLYADKIEGLFTDELRKKLSGMTIIPQAAQRPENSAKIIRLAEQADGIGLQIGRLLESAGDAEPAVRKYINRRIAELDSQREQLSAEISRLKSPEESDRRPLTNAPELWDGLTFDEKRAVVGLLVSRIEVYTDALKIVWSC